MLDRLRSILGQRASSNARSARPAAAIPAEVAGRLRPDNTDEPLFPQLKGYGKGLPGVTQEREWWWVIRDQCGRVVGGAMVGDIGRGHPVSIDVAVDPVRQGEGWATRLYDHLEAQGIDMEAGSSASLAHCSMTPDGYRFMLGRRRRRGVRDAEAAILASATLCPACGAMDDQGRPLNLRS